MHTKLTNITLAALLISQTALAQGVPLITAQDTIAGISTDITMQGLPPNAQGDALVLPPFGAEIERPYKADESGNALVRIPGSELEQAGRYIVSLLENDAILEQTSEFTVQADTLDARNTSVQTNTNSIEADGYDEAEVTVIARDAFGNTLSGRPMKLISSRSSDSISALMGETNDNGEQTFTIASTQEGIATLRVLDLISGDVLPSEITLTIGSMQLAMGGPAVQRTLYRNEAATYKPVSTQPRYIPSQYGSPLTGDLLQGRKLYGQAIGTFDVVDHFELIVPDEMESFLDENLTIRALDVNNNIVEDYIGTVLLSSTDPTAILPSFGEITFRGSDLGEKTLVLGLRFGEIGTQLLYAEDSVDPNVYGQIEINVKGKGGTHTSAGQISMLSPAQDALVKDPRIVIDGKGPPFINLLITGGLRDTEGSTDIEGNFSIPVELDPKLQDHTLRVRSGDIDSGNLHIRLDVTPPDVTKFTFTPSTPLEGDDVLVIAEITEEQVLASVSLEFNGETVEMNKTGSGVYQSVITVLTPGSYQPKVFAKDKAGNITEVRATLEVTQKGLPKVQNVQAKTTDNSVALTWDAITDVKVGAYRIYVGENPNDFAYTLDTDRDITAATVAGLHPGKDYYFAVTALDEDRESEQKSDTIKASILGLVLEVESKDSSIVLTWSELGEQIPLANYRLRYGVAPDNLTEERMLNGDLTIFTLRDLLNGVTYYVELTPITTTGDVLTDLSAREQGAPNGDGFHQSAADPIPDDKNPNPIIKEVQNPDDPTDPPIGSVKDPVPPIVNKTPPSTTETGVPHFGFWIILTLGIFGSLYYRAHRKTVRAHQEFLYNMQHQYSMKSSAQKPAPRFV